MSIDKLGSSVYNPNSSNIVDSTRPDFVSSYQKNSKEETKTEAPLKQKSNINERDVRDIVKKSIEEKVTPQDEKASADLIKNLMRTKLQSFKSSDLRPGNLVFFKYDAKLADEIVYDKTPLSMILATTKGRTLGVNFHWMPPALRKILVRLIFKTNSRNIKNNKPLDFNYRMMKPLLKRLGLLNIVTTRIASGKRVSNSCVRVYINSRISRKGLVIPPEYWLTAVGLEASSFSDGYTPRRLYKKSTKLYRANKRRLLKPSSRLRSR